MKVVVATIEVIMELDTVMISGKNGKIIVKSIKLKPLGGKDAI